MNRKLKAFGIALMVMALAAVTASAAQAQFTSSAEHTAISGSQVEAHKFTMGAGIGAINCTTASFSGTSEGKSQATLKLTPTYSGCKDSLGRTVHLKFALLVFELTSGADKGKWHFIFGLFIFEITGSSNCTITSTPQTGKNNMSYTNESGKVKLTTNTNNIHSHISGGFFACGTSATTSSSGTYTGTTLLSGNGGAASISVD